MSISYHLSLCCLSHQPDSRTIHLTIYISRMCVSRTRAPRSLPLSFPILSLSLSLFSSLFARLDGTSLRNFELAIYAGGLRLLCLAATSIARIISISLPFKNAVGSLRSRAYPVRDVSVAHENPILISPPTRIRFPEDTFLSAYRNTKITSSQWRSAVRFRAFFPRGAGLSRGDINSRSRAPFVENWNLSGN